MVTHSSSIYIVINTIYRPRVYYMYRVYYYALILMIFDSICIPICFNLCIENSAHAALHTLAVCGGGGCFIRFSQRS